mgnify:CR=1 FL=1
MNNASVVALPRSAPAASVYAGKVNVMPSASAWTSYPSSSGLPLPPEELAPGKPVYYDGSFSGNPVRIAALSTPIAGGTTAAFASEAFLGASAE